jgi:glycosyltransferase involved in cell wall biosynthesis
MGPSLDEGLSVVVCTHNRSEYIEECVQSLWESCQRLSGPWEILVVDNQSTDRTPEILAELAGRLGIRVIVEPHLGLNRARNTGIRLAVGDVIAFLDDDVIVSLEYAPGIWRAFADRQLDLAGGPLLPKWEARPPFWVDRRLYGILALMETRSEVEGKGYPRAYGANMAFRRKVLQWLGDDPFNVELGRLGGRPIGSGDSYLIDVLHARGAHIGFIAEAVAYHRVPAGRLTLKWFLRWHFYCGVSDCREARIRAGRASLPKWVVGELVRRAAEVPLYVLLFRPKDSVRSVLRFSHRLGRVYEYLRTRGEWTQAR